MTTPAPTTPDDITTQIATLEQQVSGLIDPESFADGIMDALNDLAQYEDTDEFALDAIFSNASALTETANTLQKTMHASLNLARSIQQQRDAVQARLTTLQDAVRTCDYSVPEVEALRESIEEVVMEWQAMTWADDVWDYMVELLGCNGGLDDDEVSRMLDLLNGDGPDWRSDLWAELREWIDRAELAAKHEREGVQS